MRRGDERVKRWKRADTAAPGLRVPHPYADRLILRALRQSGGTAIGVSDEEIQQARADLAAREGILACPEGAACLAGLRRLIKTEHVEEDEQVVLINTGTGLKYLS